MNTLERQRFNKLFGEIGKILLFGAGYYLFVSITGLYIPCLFRLVTGHLCPGCGISHYFVHMSHMDFNAAFHANQFIFILMPFAILYGAYRAYEYVRYNKTEYSIVEAIVMALLLVVAVGFGIYRNVVAI